jgi:hypothetical protein
MNTDPPIQTAVALEDTYKGALIGQTIDPEPRFVYSLTALTRIRSRQGHRSIEVARQDVGHMVFDILAQHGDRAPVFVDDEVSQNRPVILAPSGRRAR